ncbi:hypothetical protein WDJ51_08420 [Rathayibacter sp. YIM 133350]|uniref:hypothetical protein n=1 Tax=Rathayibacter sp. YIM 133350 TaxID=3131992 RepID=UPI00307CE03C
MKVVTNGSSRFLTGNELADAVMNYALVLRRQRKIDLVSIPALDEKGATRQAEFIVGWHVSTSTMTADDHADEDLIDVATVVTLYEKASRIGQAVPFTPREIAELTWLESYD